MGLLGEVMDLVGVILEVVEFFGWFGEPVAGLGWVTELVCEGLVPGLHGGEDFERVGVVLAPG